MSNILNHIEESPKETQRLIGLNYEQLQQLIENAERLNHEKQALLESKKVRINVMSVYLDAYPGGLTVWTMHSRWPQLILLLCNAEKVCQISLISNLAKIHLIPILCKVAH